MGRGKTVPEYSAHSVHPHSGKYLCSGGVVGDATCTCVFCVTAG